MGGNGQLVLALQSLVHRHRVGGVARVITCCASESGTRVIYSDLSVEVNCESGSYLSIGPKLSAFSVCLRVVLVFRSFPKTTRGHLDRVDDPL